MTSTKNMMHPDQKYITYLQHNDYKGIEQIYRLYAGKVSRMIVANNGTEEDAADVFQEALTDIYKSSAGGTFQLTCPFEAYLIIVCKRKWLTQLRNQKKIQVTNIEEQVYTGAEDERREAERLALMTERERIVMQLLEQLSATCREIIKACLSSTQQEQIAARMGITYGYLRKKKSECMSGLSKLVKRHPMFKN